jgi:hypothetical protein
MRLVPPLNVLSPSEVRAERAASLKRTSPKSLGVSLKDPNWIDGAEHFRRQFAKFTGDGNKTREKEKKRKQGDLMRRRRYALKKEIERLMAEEGYVPPEEV